MSQKREMTMEIEKMYLMEKMEDTGLHIPEVQDTSIDAALIMGSMRSETMAKELARKLLSEQPINNVKPVRRELTLTEALLHHFGYLYPDGESAVAGDEEVDLVGYPEALPEDFYSKLPRLLQGLPMEHREYPHLRDAVLMGLLTVLSAVTPYCTVVENTKNRSCTLYTFVVGNPSAGKSSVTNTKDVLLGIDKQLRLEKEEKMRDYARRKQAYDIRLREVERNTRKLSVDELAEEIAQIGEPELPFTPQIMMPQRTTEARFIQEMVQNQGLPLLMLLSEVKDPPTIEPRFMSMATIWTSCWRYMTIPLSTRDSRAIARSTTWSTHRWRYCSLVYRTSFPSSSRVSIRVWKVGSIPYSSIWTRSIVLRMRMSPNSTSRWWLRCSMW